jgi:hypothetical protein
MTQPEYAQRCVLQAVCHAPKNAREQRAPPRDFVVPRINLRVRDQRAVESSEQRAKIARGVRADVRRELGTQKIGQPADEGNVAEDVPLAEIRAVRLEWIQTIRREDNNGTTALTDAMRFANRLRVVRDVFTAAGGTHDDWDTYDRVMRDERRTAVLVTPGRVYSNPA